jgi:hypothetical protein
MMTRDEAIVQAFLVADIAVAEFGRMEYDQSGRPNIHDDRMPEGVYAQVCTNGAIKVTEIPS